MPTATKAKPEAAKAEKKGPNFALKAVKALAEVQVDDGEGGTVTVTAPAPNKPRTRTVSREELIANLRKLQTNPNKWYEIAEYAARAGTEEKPGGGRKVVQAFVNGRIVAPEGEGEYEMDWRDASYDGSDRKGSVVVAVYWLEGQ